MIESSTDTAANAGRGPSPVGGGAGTPGAS